MFTHTNTNSIRSAMTTLQGLGVVKVNIGFSGGNDEGGADAITYLDAAGEKVETGLPETGAYQSTEFDATTNTWKPTGWIVTEWDRDTGKHSNRPATDEEVRATQLREVLEAPIYDRFGSFAGEFSVYGDLTWDVATGTHEMHGQESYSQWDSF